MEWYVAQHISNTLQHTEWYVEVRALVVVLVGGVLVYVLTFYT